MIRFIFACMAVVAFSGLFMATQFMTGGINEAREEVIARNAPQTVEPTVAATENEISFEEIYANAKAPDQSGEAFFSPEELNAIDTTAGGNEFSDGFTNEAPKALRDPVASATLNAAQPSAE